MRLKDVMIPVFFLYGLSASSFTIGKAVLDYTQPFFFLGVRMILVGMGLLGYYWYRHGLIKKVALRDLVFFVAMMVIHIYLAFGFELVALQSMNSYKAAFLYNISPFVTALLSYFYFAEVMTAKKVIGLLIGFCGFLPELIAYAPQEVLAGGIGFLSWPEIMMFIAVVATSCGWIFMRFLARSGYSPLFINGVAMIGGGALSILTSLAREQWHPVPVSNWQQFIWLTVAIAVLNDVLFYNVYGYLLRKYTATFMSFAGFSMPIIAAVFGWLFLQETITWQFVFSIVLVSAGITLFYFEELRQGYMTSS